MLQQALADLGPVYLIILGAIAILVMLKAPGGLRSLVPARWSRLVFPVQLQVRTVEPMPDPHRLRTVL